MIHAQPSCLLWRRIEQVPLRTDKAAERHDHFLANRVDGRVRYLGKQLLEIVIDHPRLVR